MLKILLFIVIFILLLLLCYTITYGDYIKSSKYGVWVVYGVMGSGKSTLLQRFIVEAYLEKWNIYSNFDMAFASKLDALNMYKYSYPENSLLLVDEAASLWNNRDYKNFPQEFALWLKDIRKQKLRVVFVSQGADMDKKIRDSAHRIYILNKMWLFSIAKPVASIMDITNNSGDSANSNGGDIIFKYQYMPFFNGIGTFIPRYADLFDSFKRITDLPLMDYEPVLSDEVKLTKKWYKFHKREFGLTRGKSLFSSLVSRVPKFKKDKFKKSKISDENSDEVNKLFGFDDK